MTLTRPSFKKVKFPDIDVRRGKDALLAVVCGSAHTVALSASGRLFAWGANQCGQLGLGHFKRTPFPANISALGTQVGGLVGGQVSRHYVCSWGSTRPTVCMPHAFMPTLPLRWGSAHVPVPTAVESVTFYALLLSQKIVRVASGTLHCLALGEDGRVWSWGLGKDGRLGRNTCATSVVPQCVTGLFSSLCKVEEVRVRACVRACVRA